MDEPKSGVRSSELALGLGGPAALSLLSQIPAIKEAGIDLNNPYFMVGFWVFAICYLFCRTSLKKMQIKNARQTEGK